MSDNNAELNESFCNLLFSNEALNEKETKTFTNILKTMNDDNIHVPYEMITQRVFECDENQLDVVIKTANESLTVVENDENKNIIDSTRRHLELSKIQDRFINEKTKKADEKLNEINENSEKLSEIKNSIYSDLISVLGVFTAISFAAFGGITAVSNMFHGLDNNKSHVGFLLICASISFLLIYGVSVTLFVGINKLIKSEESEKPYRFSGLFTCMLIFIPILILIFGLIILYKF
ncbi:hypothetical protein M3M39_01760 [Fructilactobacillus hinvesii]|uniref:DUF1129 family protein n=1 Tax=Fructilactobacillus hinvesii TaxID=2940300 RepID=A0ABY5BX43_9LACO|nr:hypothetical protein [Fructilactobacillus hinvesii]USS88228.1 hypothetical protein M3M39_01760 [Fructilactobacillus hinvesii]